MSIILLGLIGLISVYFASMVAIVQYKEDTSIANFTWGGGVMLVTLYLFFTTGLFLPRHILITVLITIWASRLALYVYLRYTGNDPRYQTWKHQGLLVNFFYIFGLQFLLMLIMSLPSLIIFSSAIPGLTVYDYIGLCIWVIGFFFEAVSDYQLFMFTKDPANKGHLMRSGLWRYSRHPNYFGEVLMWWGISFITMSSIVTSFNITQWHAWYPAFISAGTITFLLLFVTGIPWVEKALEKNPEFAEYKRTTSIFIPWFVKQ